MDIRSVSGFDAQSPRRRARKAIEIANALLEEGMDEGKAIPIAISKAREWVIRHLERED